MKDLPAETSQALGKSLLNVQLGIDPVDWKMVTQIGPGTIEIRVHRPHEYRLLYVARFPEAIYVLHVFEKKTQKTPEKDIQLARQRYGQLQQEREKR